eukprot:1483662-Rhodomonas_salina.2
MLPAGKGAVRTLVRMVLDGHLLVGLLDLLDCCALRNAQDLVQLGVVHRLAGPAAARHSPRKPSPPRKTIEASKEHPFPLLTDQCSLSPRHRHGMRKGGLSGDSHREIYALA